MGKSSKKSSKKSKRKVRNPDKPKKPPTSYVLYCGQARPELKERCPTATFAESNKMLGEQWKRLPESDRKIYVQRAAALKLEYQKELLAYQAKHPDSDDDDKRKKRRKTKKKWRDPRRPKNPTTAYFFFQADIRGKVKEENPTLKVSDIARVVADRWNALSDEQKKPFQKLALKDRERYQRERSAYEHMLKEEKAAKHRQPSSSSSSSSSSSGSSSSDSDSDSDSD